MRWLQVLAAMRAGETVPEKQSLALAAAEAICAGRCRALCGDWQAWRKIHPERDEVLTHCNAGWLAFVDIGSATAPMYAAQAAGRKFHVFCDETRPRCQGATLTAWELAQQGISHQIIADNAAGHLMQRGQDRPGDRRQRPGAGADGGGGEQDWNLHQGGAGEAARNPVLRRDPAFDD